ncbi:Protein of unknown function [Gryllus bimaculatus]|nr:Protein of unknown function [Gryllus bimaculatus]
MENFQEQQEIIGRNLSKTPKFASRFTLATNETISQTPQVVRLGLKGDPSTARVFSTAPRLQSPAAETAPERVQASATEASGLGTVLERVNRGPSSPDGADYRAPLAQLDYDLNSCLAMRGQLLYAECLWWLLRLHPIRWVHGGGGGQAVALGVEHARGGRAARVRGTQEVQARRRREAAATRGEVGAEDVAHPAQKQPALAAGARGRLRCRPRAASASAPAPTPAGRRGANHAPPPAAPPPSPVAPAAAAVAGRLMDLRTSLPRLSSEASETSLEGLSASSFELNVRNFVLVSKLTQHLCLADISCRGSVSLGDGGVVTTAMIREVRLVCELVEAVEFPGFELMVTAVDFPFPAAEADGWLTCENTGTYGISLISSAEGGWIKCLAAAAEKSSMTSSKYKCLFLPDDGDAA